MEKGIVDNLSVKILKRIKDGKEIRDEQILLFLEWVLDTIEKQEFQDLPSSYYLLKEKIYKYRIYDKMEELEVNQAFSYGNLWSSMRLIEIAEKRKKEEISIEVLAKKYIKNIEVFKIMKNSPSIKHKDLAEKCGKTASELSQFFNQISEESFFSFIRLGREKYYYLEDKGVCLLEQMEKQNEISEINTELAATNEKFVNIVKPMIDIKYNIKITESFVGDKNEQEEYLVVLQNKIQSIFSDERAITVCDESDKDYTSIKHFYRKENQLIKVFEGKMKKLNREIEQTSANDISIPYSKAVLGTYVNKVAII